MEKLYTNKAPEAIGPYSQAIKVGKLIFTSGQIPIDPKTADIVDGGIKEQTVRACENVKAVLEGAGARLDNVIKTTCYLSDMADFSAFNEIYGGYFTSKPARSCVAVKALPKSVLVEIEVIAEI